MQTEKSRGLTDNVGNEVYRVSGFIPSTRGLGFLGLHRRLMFDYFFPMTLKKYYFSFVISFTFDILRRITTECHSTFFVVEHK